MRKFLLLVFIACFMGTLSYAAPQIARKNQKKTVRNADIVELCDPQSDPDCSNGKTSIKIEKNCGRSGRPLRVAGMIGNAPFGWVEADRGTRTNMQSFGLGRVVWDKIAKDLDIRYTSTGFVSHDEAIQALRKGNIDLFLGVYHGGIKEKDIEIILPAYFTNYFTVYFKKGKELPVESYYDLIGLKGVVRKEEMIYPLIYQRLPKGVDLKEVLSAPKVLEMLMNDEVDYVMASPYSMEGELRRYKMQNDIISDGVILDTATIFFAISKNSFCYSLKDEISDILRQKGFSQKTLDSDIKKLIDDWGERFRSDEVLMKTKNNTSPEKMSEEDQNTEVKGDN